MRKRIKYGMLATVAVLMVIVMFSYAHKHDSFIEKCNENPRAECFIENPKHDVRVDCDHPHIWCDDEGA